MNKKNSKGYLGIVIVAILALILANPGWLPLPQSLKDAVIETEKNNLLFRSDMHTTVAQLITVVLAVCVVWLVYMVLKLLLYALARRG
nr:hypothetical protein [Lachnospiraceae bacterium]